MTKDDYFSQWPANEQLQKVTRGSGTSWTFTTTCKLGLTMFSTSICPSKNTWQQNITYCLSCFEQNQVLHLCRSSLLKLGDSGTWAIWIMYWSDVWLSNSPVAATKKRHRSQFPIKPTDDPPDAAMAHYSEGFCRLKSGEEVWEVMSIQGIYQTAAFCSSQVVCFSNSLGFKSITAYTPLKFEM